LRRALRLYPIYCAAIVLEYISQPQSLTVAFLVILALNILFLNQALTTTSYVGPAWSLSLEFWLYGLTPLFCRWPIRRLKWLIAASFAFYFFYTCGRSLLGFPYYSGLGFGLVLPALAFMWISGLCLALRPQSHARILRGIGGLMGAYVSLEIALKFAYRVKNHHIPEFFSADLGEIAVRAFTLILVWSAFKILFTAAQEDCRRSRFLTTLGDVSFPLYLIHVPIYRLLTRAGIRDATLLLCGAVTASYFVYLGVDFYSRRRERTATIPALGAQKMPALEPAKPKPVPLNHG
jgi:peptidoglycan/LPS O-acetylase OafA/YrhL